MDEKELVKRAQSGDFDAFNRLITEQKDKIYRLALKLTGNREDAEDIVQETFLKAVDNIDKFRLESSFGTWLYTIALNSVRAHMGTRKRMNLKPFEEYLPSGHSVETTHAQLFDWSDPHKLFEQKQLDQIIETALAAMPKKYSIPFMLRYMEDLSVKEVAKIMKLSLPAAKSRILRARLALREQLAEHFQEKTNEKV
jgi:RNA polymerase sigma-70 factor (ECF subfamily)